MRPSVVSEAGLQTRLGQWWEGIPFLTSTVVIVCGVIYLVCLLVGYDSFLEVCFLPAALVSHLQVYRIYTAILFHGSLIHVLFNMLALIPLGSELERIMGSIRLLHVTLILATANAVFHLFIALLVAHNPFHPDQYFMNECGIGFSGILFSMIVIETNLSGVHSRSVFGLFNVPAKWYAWILLVVFQLIMTNVSLLGHLCGILSGYAYVEGLFNCILPGPSIYSAAEASPLLSFFVRRPKFILCTGGNPSGFIPTHSSHSTPTSGLFSGNMWSNLSSWIPHSETSAQVTQDSRFPGSGRTVNSGQSQSVFLGNPNSDLQDRLLDNSSPPSADSVPSAAAGHVLDERQSSLDRVSAVAGAPASLQGVATLDKEIEHLLLMGFDQTQVEVALAAADGDVNIAAEILMSQQA